jgi:hypothetical protein
MAKYKKKPPITKEELLEIKSENKRKLDIILNTPNFMEVIGRKYYGDDWMSTLMEGHYLKVERRKEYNHANMKRQRSSDFVPRVAATTLPIIELTLDGEFVREWTNIKEWKAENSTKHYITPIQCAKGKAPTAYGKKWVFKSDYKKELNG